MLLKNIIKIGLSLSTVLTLATACNRGDSSNIAAIETSTIQSVSSDTSENEYLIKRRGLSYLKGDAAFQQEYGVTLIKKINSLLIDVVKIEKPEDLEKLRASGVVDYVEPNYIRKMNVKPAQDGKANIASVTQSGITKANSIYKGNPYISVAVVSTGVDLKHPDLKGKLAVGFSSFSDTDTAQDINGIGTHQAGVIVASNATSGVYGIAPSCKVMPIKAFNDDGAAKDSDLVQGIAWAVDHGANVVTFTAEGTTPSKAIDDVVKYAFNKKVPIIVGSGDTSSTTPTYPAATAGIISVSAMGTGSQIASFSNKGSYVSVAAPGENILSTSSTTQLKQSANYATLSGTAIAAAYAAGEMALIRSKFPELDMLALRKHLELTSDDLSGKGSNDSFGYGRINAEKALNIQPPKKK